MTDLALVRPQTDAERAHALMTWLAGHLGEHFRVEMPTACTPPPDGFHRYYVRQGGRRAVVRVMGDFLSARDADGFSASLLAGSPTLLDLIRAGALHIDVDGRGVASAFHPPCR